MNVIIVGCGNIGFETVKLLSKGNSILLIDISQPEYIVEFLRKNANVSFARCDATDLSKFKEILAQFDKKFHRIDALICTVGANPSCYLLTDFEEYENCFKLNFFGNLIPIKAVSEKMISQKAGKIVIISSTSGHFCPPYIGPYSASKWAIENLCGSLRNELKPLGIDIDVISPRRIKNKHSKTFTFSNGTEPEYIAEKIVKIIDKPANSNHYIPRKYRFLHIIERVSPHLLNWRFGLRRNRKRIFKKMEIESALITGASSGLGRDLALQYSKKVNTLFLVARNYAALNQLKDEILQTGNCEVHIASVDVGEYEAVKELTAKIEQIDLIINNAGFRISGGIIDVPVDIYRQNFAVNFFGPVLLTREFLKKEKKPKKIINVLSTTAIGGRKGLSCYSAAKSALWSFSRSVRREYGNEIQIIEAIPSTFSSNLFQRTIEFANESRIQSNVNTLSRPSIIRKIISPVMSSQYVAKLIVRAEEKGKEIVMIPSRAKIFLFVEAFFPRFFQKIFK